MSRHPVARQLLIVGLVAAAIPPARPAATDRPPTFKAVRPPPDAANLLRGA